MHRESYHGFPCRRWLQQRTMNWVREEGRGAETDGASVKPIFPVAEGQRDTGTGRLGRGRGMLLQEHKGNSLLANVHLGVSFHSTTTCLESASVYPSPEAKSQTETQRHRETLQAPDSHAATAPGAILCCRGIISDMHRQERPAPDTPGCSHTLGTLLWSWRRSLEKSPCLGVSWTFPTHGRWI